MEKVRITNRTRQAIPFLLRDKEKKFVHGQLRAGQGRMITADQVSPQLESLHKKGIIRIERLTAVIPKRQSPLTARRARVAAKKVPQPSTKAVAKKVEEKAEVKTGTKKSTTTRKKK